MTHQTLFPRYCSMQAFWRAVGIAVAILGRTISAGVMGGTMKRKIELLVVIQQSAIANKQLGFCSQVMNEPLAKRKELA